jgi:hypothetical protein
LIGCKTTILSALGGLLKSRCCFIRLSPMRFDLCNKQVSKRPKKAARWLVIEDMDQALSTAKVKAQAQRLVLEGLVP